MGIEPTLSAWEAEVLPLNYTRRRETGTMTLDRHINRHRIIEQVSTSRYLRRTAEEKSMPAEKSVGYHSKCAVFAVLVYYYHHNMDELQVRYTPDLVVIKNNQ
jgi:hypothetical protein